jgi:hypothetical protein
MMTLWSTLYNNGYSILVPQALPGNGEFEALPRVSP